MTGVTRFPYDGAGNVLSVTDAQSNTTAYGFDNLNRKVTETIQLPAGQTPPQVFLTKPSHNT